MNFSLIKIKMLTFLIVGSFCASAQFNLGVQGSYLNTLTDGNVGHPGFGLFGEGELDEIVAIQAGFHYYFPSNYSREIQAVALSPNTSPVLVAIQTKSKITLMDFYIGFKYYVVGTHSTFKKESPTAVYVGGDVGVLAAGFEATTDSTYNINWNLYDVPVKDTQLGSFTFLSLNPTIGVEKRISTVYLFSELKLLVNIVETSSSGLEFDIPFVVNFNVGVRIPFGGDY